MQVANLADVHVLADENLLRSHIAAERLLLMSKEKPIPLRHDGTTPDDAYIVTENCNEGSHQDSR